MSVASVLVALFLLLAYIGNGFSKSPPETALMSNSSVLFAHRGLANYFPENTKRAITAALDVGFEAVEIDLSYTKDRKLVVFHRGNEQEILHLDHNIEYYNWAELKNKPIFFKGIQTDNNLLSFDSFLSIINSQTMVYIDIKKAKFWIADSLAKKLKQASYNQFLLASSQLSFMVYCKHKHPLMLTCLEGFNNGKEWSYSLIPSRYKPNYISSFLHQSSKEHNGILNNKKILQKKITYGISKENIFQAQELGCSHLIVDFDSTMLDYIQ